MFKYQLKLAPIGLLFLSAISPNVFARTDCPPALVENIQIERDFVLYKQVGSSWRRLGSLSTIGTKERLAALLAAQATGRKVMVGYAGDNYNCRQTNYTTPAYIVRTYQ